MNADHFLAFDIGAESGRTVLGTLRDQKIQIKELNRFSNNMINICEHLHWNVLQLYENIKHGIKICASEITTNPLSLAVDTWGVDFGLLANDGSFIGFPYAYRDRRTVGAMEEFFKSIPRQRIYELTGIQFMPLNTLFQLFSMVRDQSPLLKIATDLLFIPDIFNYLFTGEKRTEFTFATTSQLYNPRTKDWDDDLFTALGISKSIMQEIVPPKTRLGNLNHITASETGLNQVPVIATASHDTGSAVAAVPTAGYDWAYISSGTWSLMGVETPEPIINDQTLEYNFTNEGGIEDTFRLLKNVTGLWLVQGCRKSWIKEWSFSYNELFQMAATASPFKAFIDPDYPGFLNPTNMVEAIHHYCRQTNQPDLEKPAEVVRCILECLALKYHLILDQLRQVYSHPINKIHIIGGGSQNRLLCQFTANACGLPVIAGPVEATAIGNIMVQALGLGFVSTLTEIREVINRSVELMQYEPQRTAEWDQAFLRFKEQIHEK